MTRWPARMRMAAALIPPGSKVIDLGAGSQALRDMLPAGCSYTSVDLANADITCSLSVGELPEGFDVAVFLGVLEYLTDPEWALRQARRAARKAVVSCAHSHHSPHRIPVDQFLRICRRAGWRPSVAGRWDGQTLYRLRRA
jgi:hypothetical protein